MRELTEQTLLFEQAGFRLARQNKHKIWRCPCGQHQIWSSSSKCEGRAHANCKALIARTLRKCKQNMRETKAA